LISRYAVAWLTELGREFRNISGRRAVRIALQEAADRIRPSARFIPKRLINLVREMDRSWQARKEKTPSSDSHIKWQTPRAIIKLTANSQIKCRHKHLESLVWHSHN
jgi:hypothetical protein